jgi:hypothetical protein
MREEREWRKKKTRKGKEKKMRLSSYAQRCMFSLNILTLG